MKTKITQSIPILFVFVAIGFRYFSQKCILMSSSCYGTWVHHIYNYTTNPLYFFTLYSLPLAIILILIPRHLFNSWLKLALWAIPLSFIFIAMTPVNSNAYMDFFPFYRDDAARLAAEAFSVVSLIFIIWKTYVSPRV